MTKKVGISLSDIFPVSDDEITKYPLLAEFMTWFVEDGTNLENRQEVMDAFEMNLNCLASASIISSIENYQELLKEAQSKTVVLPLDNGSNLIITSDD